MAAPMMTLKMDGAAAPIWLAGNWISKTRWATVTPLLRGRVSVKVGVAT